MGAIGGGPDGMEVDGAKRTLYVGTHSLAHRRDGMEVGAGCLAKCLGTHESAVALLAMPPACVPAVSARSRHNCRFLRTSRCLPFAATARAQIVSPFKDGILNDWEAVDGILEHALK